MIRTSDPSSPSPYLPQEPPEVPQLAKMINLPQAAETSPVKSEPSSIPALIQADANSNYQPQPPPTPPHHQTTASNHSVPHPSSHPVIPPPPPQSSGPPGSAHGADPQVQIYFDCSNLLVERRNILSIIFYIFFIFLFRTISYNIIFFNRSRKTTIT